MIAANETGTASLTEADKSSASVIIIIIIIGLFRMEYFSNV